MMMIMIEMKKKMIVVKKKLLILRRKKLIIVKKNKKITHKQKFIESYRFMLCKLSDLVDNLSGIHDKECKKCMEEKKLGRNVNLLNLKIIDYITGTKNAINHILSGLMRQLKILINFFCC